MAAQVSRKNLALVAFWKPAMVAVAGAGCLVGVAGALIGVAGTAGAVKEVDVGTQVVRLVNFGGAVAMRLVEGGVGVVVAAVDAAVAESAAGTVPANVADVGPVAEGAKKAPDSAAGAGNSSGVAGGFAVAAAEQELANGTAAAGAVAEFDIYVNRRMSAGVGGAEAALAKL
jgi:hypothetical protein